MMAAGFRHARNPFRVAALFLVAFAASTACAAIELNNGEFRVDLRTDEAGAPCIASAEWIRAEGASPAFIDTGADGGMKAWAPKRLIARRATTSPWQRADNEHFLCAEAQRPLKHGLLLTWHVELAKKGSILRLYTTIENASPKPREVPSFPAWAGQFAPAGGAQSLEWWDALSFLPREQRLDAPVELTLSSRLHSSDTEPSRGVNPYWVLKSDSARLFFALEWCGGWKAALKGSPDSLDFAVGLPTEETQLTLAPGERVTGPVLDVAAVRATNDREARAVWMRQRADLAQALYGGPAPAFPFTYNNWYTTRFALDAAFLRRQLEALPPYHFDYFIVDAGWYKGCGRWEPDPAKFPGQEFEDILRAIRESGAKIGIWSCPQFTAPEANPLPGDIDEPGLYEKFINGHLLDLVGVDFPKRLCEHVAMLRGRYLADWWKYDQIFFAAKTRQGVMKNVIAFQNALLAVRKAQPDLMIENCQSGGRMTNEFTVLFAQNHWIRDGGDTGLDHARKENVAIALGALMFMPPWSVNRWTNNPDRNDPNDDEFATLYCRSAMAGTWGLVADLAQIGDRQRAIIVREAENYRRLAPIKGACRYDILYPKDGTASAGIVFFDSEGKNGAALLYRMGGEEALDITLSMEALSAARAFRIDDADSAASLDVDGPALRREGLRVHFDAEQLSRLLFLSAIE